MLAVVYAAHFAAPTRFFLTARGCAWRSVSEPLYLVLVDLHAEKSTVRILDALQACYPDATTDEQARVQHALGDGNLDITGRALAAMQAGDAEALGRIMDESHLLFTQAGAAVCPDQLTAPVLQSVLTDPAIRTHVWCALLPPPPPLPHSLACLPCGSPRAPASTPCAHAMLLLLPCFPCTSRSAGRRKQASSGAGVWLRH